VADNSKKRGALVAGTLGAGASRASRRPLPRQTRKEKKRAVLILDAATGRDIGRWGEAGNRSGSPSAVAAVTASRALAVTGDRAGTA